MDVYKRLSAPLSAQIEITGLCNQNCQHCYNFWREKNNRSGKPLLKPKNISLSRTDTVSIVQKLAKEEVFHLTVTGGEPLLNMGACLACIKMAVSADMGIGMNSNLTLLTSKKAKALKEAGLNHILTSIMGPPEIHDAIAQKRGAFKRLTKGIKIAHEAGLRISANMVVSQLNFGTVKATAQSVKRLGIKNFMATKVSCPGNCNRSDFSMLSLSNEEVVQLLNDLCWVKKNINMNIDTLEPVPLCGMLGVENPELFMSRRCNAGTATITVSYDGSVRPCPSLDISYGNLLMEDLSDIWSRMDLWCHGFQIPDECKKCPLFPFCGSGCRMEAKTRMGSLNSNDPYMKVDNIKKMTEVIFGLQKQQKQTISLPKHAKTAKFRLRKEAFGGIMNLEKSQKKVFLDHRGFGVLSQLKPNTNYDFPINVDWKGLGTDFIVNLVQRKVLLYT